MPWCWKPTHSTLLLLSEETASINIYTLSLHDALPIYVSRAALSGLWQCSASLRSGGCWSPHTYAPCFRSEEHTSELQSQSNLVCRPLLEKKNIRPLAGVLLAGPLPHGHTRQPRRRLFA